MKILIVEDEKELAKTIAEGLSLAGYVTSIASDGEEALNLFYEEIYSLVILDINLPKMDGFTVLKEMRKNNKSINIILLTARSYVEDRVKGLDLGANDYMVKPFYFEELEARIRSLLRRKTVQTEAIIRHGQLSYDMSSQVVKVGEEEIKLTKKEQSILEYLLLNRGRYVSQYEILENIWEDDVDCFSNTVRVHMAALRKKIKEAMGENIIKNEIGKGYIIDEIK